MFASCVPPTEDLAHNPDMCPDWESNLHLFGSEAGMQYTEPQQPGLLISTLNPIEYSPAVLLHLAFPVLLITYKTRWELWIPVKPLEGRTY